MSKWRETRNSLKISEEDKNIMAGERLIINTMIDIRKKCGMTQKELAQLCELDQSAISRMEKDTHSPQIFSMLKVLKPMGYTLQIVPVEQG